MPEVAPKQRHPARVRKKLSSDGSEEARSKQQTELPMDDEVVVKCDYSAPTGAAMLDDKSLNWIHLMKLQSDMPFRLIKQVVLQEGTFKGHVAVIIKQERPFPILDLPIEIRAKILKLLLEHGDGSVPIVNKRSRIRKAISPAYKGQNRLSILRTNRQINAEASTIFYGQLFHFLGTQLAHTFLLQIGRHRQYLRTILLDIYHAKTARAMFQLLQDAPHLERLSFAHVTSNSTPKTAVNSFYKDASEWLLALDKDDPLKGLDILDFDAGAFHMRKKAKDGTVTIRRWGEEEQLVFIHGLKDKLLHR